MIKAIVHIAGYSEHHTYSRIVATEQQAEAWAEVILGAYDGGGWLTTEAHPDDAPCSPWHVCDGSRSGDQYS